MKTFPPEKKIKKTAFRKKGTSIELRELSLNAVRRIQDNFVFLKIIQEIRKSPIVKSVSKIRGSLPNIYANNR